MKLPTQTVTVAGEGLTPRKRPTGGALVENKISQRMRSFCEKLINAHAKETYIANYYKSHADV